MIRHTLSWCAFVVCVLPLAADEKSDPAARLAQLDAAAFSPEAAQEKRLAGMVEREVRGRLHAALQREANAFAQLKGRADWERFRDARLQALRESLGPLPERGELKVKVARTFQGDGYMRDDLVYESRPGLCVTANLYYPAKAPAKMPGLLIVHGFHQPKQQGELQDMGVNWARLGCQVLVMDVLCHGERQQHPFIDASKYPGKFNVPRQDYYSRANAETQLFLCGESLMGWMVQDVLRGVDLLLARPGIDKERIIVLGAVAAGGDIAAVAAALDPRIAGVAPYNFGGPEPETIYPLPAEPVAAERAFPYGVGGHWDSTRKLRNSARDGFLPWVIVGAAAPRRVIYAHEFAWDQKHDPVWPRLEKIFELSEAKAHLGFAHGSGTLFGNPEGTGCANIGPVHRQGLYPHFQRWFGMPAPTKEAQDRKPAGEMLALVQEIDAARKPKTVQQLTAELGRQRWLASHQALVKLPTVDERKQQLRRDWSKLLGAVEPAGEPKATAVGQHKLGAVAVERIVLETEPGILVPLVLLVPPSKADGQLPVVVGVAQHGKQEFLQQRAAEIAALLQAGVAICLPDVRGTGETRCEGDLRGPPAGSYKGVFANSRGTLLANENLMLGRTLLGDRLRDLRGVLHFLKTRPELDRSRLALWGDSFAPVNAADARVEVPWDAEKLPAQAEPLGGLLALFGALYEDDVRAVHVQGGLASWQTLLQSQFCQVPHDVIVPGALHAGEIGDVVAALHPRPVSLRGLVDGRNRRADQATVTQGLEPALRAYKLGKSEDKLSLDGKDDVAGWLSAQLRK
ncbi:MAG: acetylxylan esterase [Planctomycetia bacterium]|nr:acetylxylan esterase [Planctomycetia bacterium]